MWHSSRFSLHFVNAANPCPIHIVSIIHCSITIQQIVQRNLPPRLPELVQILPRVGQFRCIKSAWLGSSWIKFCVHYFSIDPKLQDLASTPQSPFFRFTLSAPPPENTNNKANHKLTRAFVWFKWDQYWNQHICTLDATWDEHESLPHWWCWTEASFWARVVPFDWRSCVWGCH